MWKKTKMLKCTPVLAGICAAMFITDAAHAGAPSSFSSILQNRLIVLENRIIAEPDNEEHIIAYNALLVRLGLPVPQKAQSAIVNAAIEPMPTEILLPKKAEAAIEPMPTEILLPKKAGAVGKLEAITRLQARLEGSEAPDAAPDATPDATPDENTQAQRFEELFSSAKKSEKEGDWEAAEAAYLEILSTKSELPRVKLDLGLLYARRGYNKDSKRLFDEVLESSPPPSVQKNVNKVLETVERGLKKHEFGGVLLAGLNLDSNGNSVSSSGNVLINDVLVPLTSTSTSQSDIQAIAYGGLTHNYNFDFDREDNFKNRWYTNVSAYASRQKELTNINIRLASIKTGPKFRHIGTGADFGYNMGYSTISLDGKKYLNSFSNELYINYPLTPTLLSSNMFTYEHRHFVNTPSNTTISARTGETYQLKDGLKFILTEKDILDTTLLLRREVTREDYYDNRQLQISLGYLHAFDAGFMTNLSSSFRMTSYDQPDPFVSALTVRSDKESVGGLSVSKSINSAMLTLGYEFKNVNSNVENYKFKNHRVSTSVAYSF